MSTFHKRKFLNPKGSASVVAFHGETQYYNSEGVEEVYFLEVSDCRNKISLHKTKSDSVEDFVNKMKKLRCVLDEFIEYLEFKQKYD